MSMAIFICMIFTESRIVFGDDMQCFSFRLFNFLTRVGGR